MDDLFFDIEDNLLTEHSLELALFMEVHYKIYAAARLAIDNSKSDSSITNSTFLNGAYLRIILDSASELFAVSCMGLAAQKRFIKHWKSGKPTNQFKVSNEGKEIQLTTGFIRRSTPIINELYEALNPHIHPSMSYYNRIIKRDDNSLFIDNSLPKDDITGLEIKVFNLFENILRRYRDMINLIKPTTTEYRVIKYSDSNREFMGEPPVEIKVYKD